MANKLKVENMSEFDMAQELRSEADIIEYLQQVLEEGDGAELAAALGHIAKSRGMSEIARASGIKREALYKALRPQSHPRFDTIQRVCKALGVRLTVEKAPEAAIH
ncbi:MAG: putative addiction module antidote protein [Desulfuromonadaceae bacterium]|nr:putative addiction module antidote protein [Desulfuromonadaceae bacterium]